MLFTRNLSLIDSLFRSRQLFVLGLYVGGLVTSRWSLVSNELNRTGSPARYTTNRHRRSLTPRIYHLLIYLAHRLVE